MKPTNQAQALLQPLIDVAREKNRSIPYGSNGDDSGARAEAALYALEEASLVLEPLTAQYSLADVPTVKWHSVTDESRLSGDWMIWRMKDGSYCAETPDQESHYGNMEQCKRYVEIRIHLASYERALLAELAKT